MRALILGGGDGGVATRLLQHPELSAIVMCEIDQVACARMRACVRVPACVCVLACVCMPACVRVPARVCLC